MTFSAFVAYPAGRPLVSEAVSGAVELSKSGGPSILAWEAMRVVGFRIDNEIREQIKNSGVLIADITYANANVYYEIGYAIAVGKHIVPMLNSGVEKAAFQINQIGLFDTIGYAMYENSSDFFCPDLRD